MIKSKDTSYLRLGIQTSLKETVRTEDVFG